MPRWRALPDELDPQVREFASQLRRLVDRSGLSVAAVADRTGYSKTSWERYLNGRLLAPKGAIVALAEVTGTNPVHLTTMWELAERAWSRSEMRHDMTMEAIRISQARAALGEFGSTPAKGDGTGSRRAPGVVRRRRPRRVSRDLPGWRPRCRRGLRCRGRSGGRRTAPVPGPVAAVAPAEARVRAVAAGESLPRLRGRPGRPGGTDIPGVWVRRVQARPALPVRPGRRASARRAPSGRPPWPDPPVRPVPPGGRLRTRGRVRAVRPTGSGGSGGSRCSSRGSWVRSW